MFVSGWLVLGGKIRVRYQVPLKWGMQKSVLEADLSSAALFFIISGFGHVGTPSELQM
jgi:hypothetical protein